IFYCLFGFVWIFHSDLVGLFILFCLYNLFGLGFMVFKVDYLICSCNFGSVGCFEYLKQVRSKQASFSTFREFIRTLGVVEIMSVGQPFTWANNRRGSSFVEEKLDRFFVSPDLNMQFPNSIVKHINLISSDHCMILLDCLPEILTGKKRFCFDASWVQMENFNSVVEDAWNKPVVGHALFSIQDRLRNVRMQLLQWKKSHVSNTMLTIEDCKSRLNQLRELGGDRDWGEWVNKKVDLHLAYRDEKNFWKQKARVHWLQGGDRNSKYVHACVNQRKKMNRLDGILKADGSACVNSQEVVYELLGYFEN
ncbi:Unknown protein, partial [Striga hermonthica]